MRGVVWVVEHMTRSVTQIVIVQYMVIVGHVMMFQLEHHLILTKNAWSIRRLVYVAVALVWEVCAVCQQADCVAVVMGQR